MMIRVMTMRRWCRCVRLMRDQLRSELLHDMERVGGRRRRVVRGRRKVMGVRMRVVGRRRGSMVMRRTQRRRRVIPMWRQRALTSKMRIVGMPGRRGWRRRTMIQMMIVVKFITSRKMSAVQLASLQPIATLFEFAPLQQVTTVQLTKIVAGKTRRRARARSAIQQGVIVPTLRRGRQRFKRTRVLMVK